MHPFIALGIALRARGHDATILTNPLFQPLIESQGLGFLAVGSMADVEAAIADPRLWDARKGFEVVARSVILPSISTIYRLIESHADDNTVVAASSISFGARIAQEKLGLPTASIHLQPIVLRSHFEQGIVGNMRISAHQPMWFKKAFFRFVDWAAIDRVLKGPLNEFRATLGLSPVSRVLHRWIHSPQCVIGFFPDWFAPPQPDWPPHTHLVGFPLWDGGGVGGPAPVAPEVRAFLDAGTAPIVVTPGSAASTMEQFFSESIAAVSKLGRRAMLVTNFPSQLPRVLPSGIQAFGYLPFSEVLPRAALVVHHGGIGTSAQAMKAGVPHLIVPSAHDQFDNGWRIEHLGLGRSMPRTRYRADRAAAEIRAILDDPTVKDQTRRYAGKIDSAASIDRACELIEGLASKATNRRSSPSKM